MHGPHYPNTAYLGSRRDFFERLYDFKVRHGLATSTKPSNVRSILAVRCGYAMNRALIDQIARAVLYEGYVLYPVPVFVAEEREPM